MKIATRPAILPIAFAASALLLLSGCSAPADAPNDVIEYAIAYPDAQPPAAGGDNAAHGGGAAHAGSTHEITFDERRGGPLWITGQMHDSLVRLATDGKASFVAMPPGSGPHGIVFDSAGRLWVTLEFAGGIRMIDEAKGIVADHDVHMACAACPMPNNPQPHGLAVGPDGKTIWFTGKTAGVVGRIAPDGKVATFALSKPDSLPIYIKAGPDGNMWVTELQGNKIARVTPAGAVTEFEIRTPNSRPIAIVPGPDGAMWFSEEAGSKIGRIDKDGTMTEFPVLKGNPNLLLAGLAFDGDGNLWVQQYVDHKHPDPEVADSIIRIDKAGLAAGPNALAARHFKIYRVPTRDSVMHRIVQGPDGAMWFTEMNADKVGRVEVEPARPPA
jgi:virginiamycin B lyase